MLRKIIAIIRSFLPYPAFVIREPRETSAVTHEDVNRFNPDSQKLLMIALWYRDPFVSARAAERIRPRRFLRTLALAPEATRDARIVAITRLEFDDELFTMIAVKDGDPVVATYAAHHVCSFAHITRLATSKHDTVRLIAKKKMPEHELKPSRPKSDDYSIN